jgi:hypothetical protein
MVLSDVQIKHGHHRKGSRMMTTPMCQHDWGEWSQTRHLRSRTCRSCRQTEEHSLSDVNEAESDDPSDKEGINGYVNDGRNWNPEDTFR